MGGWSRLSSRNKTSDNPLASFEGGHYPNPPSLPTPYLAKISGWRDSSITVNARWLAEVSWPAGKESGGSTQDCGVLLAQRPRLCNPEPVAAVLTLTSAPCSWARCTAKEETAAHPHTPWASQRRPLNGICLHASGFDTKSSFLPPLSFAWPGGVFIPMS